MDKEKEYEMVCNALLNHLISISFHRKQLKIKNRDSVTNDDVSSYFPFYLEPINIDHQFFFSQHAGNDFYYFEDSSSSRIKLDYSHYKNLFFIYRNFFK